MKRIIAWEFRTNNMGSLYVAKLECGHERTDLSERCGPAGWLRPKEARCWVCKEEK